MRIILSKCDLMMSQEKWALLNLNLPSLTGRGEQKGKQKSLWSWVIRIHLRPTSLVTTYARTDALQPNPPFPHLNHPGQLTPHLCNKAWVPEMPGALSPPSEAACSLAAPGGARWHSTEPLCTQPVHAPGVAGPLSAGNSAHLWAGRKEGWWEGANGSGQCHIVVRAQSLEPDY